MNIKKYLSLVAFSHTIFAFPFALSMLVMLHSFLPPSAWFYGGIIVAMVAARTTAMSFNRIADAVLDAKNPRTQMREIPSGKVSLRDAKMLCACSALVFLLASALVGMHCLPYAPVVLLIICGYSYTKRFTAYAHFVLGLSLALAPGAIWFAVMGSFSYQPVPLMVAVLCWVAGFDILYSLQDDTFDRREGLHSIPVKLGERKARILSVVLHIATVMALGYTGALFNLGKIYFSGVALFGIVLTMQHCKVSRETIGPKFFRVNGFASVLFFVFTALDVFV